MNWYQYPGLSIFLLFASCFGCGQSDNSLHQSKRGGTANVKSPLAFRQAIQGELISAIHEMPGIDNFQDSIHITVLDNGQADLVYVGCKLGGCYGLSVEISRVDAEHVVTTHGGSGNVHLSGPFQTILTLDVPDLYGEGVLIPTEVDIVTRAETENANPPTVFVSAFRGTIK